MEHHRDRRDEDHARARRLAEGLNDLPGMRVNLDEVVSNMVYIELDKLKAMDVADRLIAKGILLLPTGSATLRAVTSLEVDEAGIDRAITVFRELMEGEA